MREGGRPRGVMCSLHGSWSSTALTPQLRTREGGSRYIERPKGGHLGFARFLVERGADAVTQDAGIFYWSPAARTVPGRTQRPCGSQSLASVEFASWASEGRHLDLEQSLVEYGDDGAA